MRKAAVILALAALVAGVLLTPPADAFIRLSSIKNRLIELALDQISSPGSFEVTAETIEDLEDGATSLVGVKVSDGTGVWLSLERLNFAWRPSRLAAGELAITRLELIGLEVTRPPAAEAEPPELKPQEPWSKGPFDWPRAPISVVVEGFKVERARIAEGVLPQEIRFDAEGRARDKGDLQEVELALRRADAVEGRIGVLMRRDFSDGTLKLDVSADEAPGGLVAAAAGFPPDAPARLKLTADGTVEDWRLDFDAAVERVFEAGGRATLAYAERLNVDADFTVTPGPAMQPELRTVLGEQARLRAQVIEQPDGMIEVVAGELTSPAVRMSATGALATGPGESDLAVSLVALAPLADLVEGVAFDRFSFDGRVTGPQGALVAEGTLGLSGLATAPADVAALSLEGRVAQTADGARFDLSGSGEGLRLDRLGPEVIGAARLAAAGALAGDVLTLERASLDSAALTVGAEGSYDLAASSGALTLDLAVPEIAPLTAAYGLSAEGQVAADAEVSLAPERVAAEFTVALEGFAMDRVEAARLGLSGRVTQAAERLAFDLEGDGEGLRLDQVPAELTRSARLELRGALEGDRLALETARLEAPLVTVEASGTVGLADEMLAVDYRLETPELAPVAAAYGAEAAGALTATGRAEGSFAAPRLAGEAALSGAAFAGRSYGRLGLTHDVSLGPAPEGRVALTLEGSWLGDGEAETAFRLQGERLRLDGLEARLLGARLGGAAEVDLGTTLIDGAFDLSAPDLGPLARFAGADLAGAAGGQVTLASVDGRQDVEATLEGRDLAAPGVQAATARVALAVADALGTPDVDLDVTARDVTAGPATLETVRAEARGPLAALDFSAEAGGTLRDEALSATLAGRADAAGEVVRVVLSRAEATLGVDTLRLGQPLKLAVGGGIVAAEGLDLALPGGGALAGAAALRPGGFTGDLTLDDLSLETVGRLAGAPLTGGRLDARASFDTRPGRAGAELAAEGRGVAFAGVEAAEQGFDLDLAADWDGARLTANAELRGGFGEPFRGRVALPLRPVAGGLPRVPQGGELDGRLDWRGRIGDLWALLPAPGHVLDGEAEIDLALGGTLAAPEVAGNVGVTGGQYQNLDTGTILTELVLRTRIDADGTFNLTLEATDGAEGRVAAEAAIRFGEGLPALDVTATARRAVLLRRDDVTAAVTADLALAGAVNELLLSGRVEVDQAEVRLVNATPPEVVDLEGIRMKGASEPEGNGDGESVVRLDLTVAARRDIFVRGRGLDSEWGMELRVTGDAAAPVVAGQIERVRGRLSLLGRAFELERGRVTFDGGREIDPELDVYLEREDHGIRGGIVVSGRASEPELDFTSVPALPEDEVLPRLLFGQSRQSLTGPQALQLAAGLATLMGGRAGPLDALRETAGLDMLRVEGETVEDAAVTVGRNVGENVFIGAKQGLGGQGSAVTVEVEVFRGVTVDTEVGQEGNSNIGITLKKDF